MKNPMYAKTIMSAQASDSFEYTQQSLIRICQLVDDDAKKETCDVVVANSTANTNTDTTDNNTLPASAMTVTNIQQIVGDNKKLQQACANLLNQVNQLKGASRFNRGGRGGGRFGRGTGRPNPSRQLSEPRTSIKNNTCHNCGKPNHLSKQCRNPCSNCGLNNHKRPQCRHLSAEEKQLYNRRGNGQQNQNGNSNGNRSARNNYLNGEVVFDSNEDPNEDGIIQMMRGATGDPNLPPGFGGIDLSMPSIFMHQPCESSAQPHVWVLDGGSSHHVTPIRAYLRDYIPDATTFWCEVANKQYVKRAGVGTVKLSAFVNGEKLTYSIKNVWHVPELGHSLFSTNQFKKAGIYLDNKPDDMTDYLKDRQGNLIMVAHCHNHLNFPDIATHVPEDQEKSWIKYLTSIEDPSVAVISYSNANYPTEKESALLWHARMGHVGWKSLEKTVGMKLIKGINTPLSEFEDQAKQACETCIAAKHRRAPFTGDRQPAKEPLERLHTDLCGPYPVIGLSKGRFALTLQDEFTGQPFAAILRTKDEAAEHLIRVINRWEKITGRNCKNLHSDRGGEFIDSILKDFCTTKGIKHTFSEPDVHQHNGIAERLNQTLNDMVLAMLLHYQLPQSLWDFALIYAVQIRSVQWNKRLNMTPHEALTGEIPDVSNFRTFGSKVYAKIDNEQRKKLQPKSELGIYLGPATDGPGVQVLVYRPEYKQTSKFAIKVFRDVVILEMPHSGNSLAPLLKEIPEIPIPDADKSIDFTSPSPAALLPKPVGGGGRAITYPDVIPEVNSNSTELRRITRSMTQQQQPESGSVPLPGVSDTREGQPQNSPQVNSGTMPLSTSGHRKPTGRQDEELTPTHGDTTHGGMAAHDVVTTSVEGATPQQRLMIEQTPNSSHEPMLWEGNKESSGTGVHDRVGDAGMTPTTAAPNGQAHPVEKGYAKSIVRLGVANNIINRVNRSSVSSLPVSPVRAQPKIIGSALHSNAKGSGSATEHPVDFESDRPRKIQKKQVQFNDPEEPKISIADLAACHTKEELEEYLMKTFNVPDLKGRPILPFTKVDKYDIPKSINQAMKSKYAPQWLEALIEEWLSHVKNKTWILVKYVQGMSVIPCHFIFTIKTDAEGKPIRFKARLVAGGNYQTEGIDYEETFAPVIRHTTLRTFFAIAARYGWKIHQVDIKTAFLHGDLDKDIFMMQPPGFSDGDNNYVCHLQKSLYGLKQSPKMWYESMSKALSEIGFSKVSSDPSLWICTNNDINSIVHLTSIVDDLAIGGPSEEMTLKVIKAILDKFPGKHSGRIYHFAGMKLSWDDDNKCVYITQPAHIEEMLDKFGQFLPSILPESLPIKPDLRLCKGGSSLNLNSPPLNTEKFPYRSLIGSLNYLSTICRPDITFIVNQLSRYANAPTQEHWDLAIKVLQYLIGTKQWGIVLGRKNPDLQIKDDHRAVKGQDNSLDVNEIVNGYDLQAQAFCDANHATGIDDKKSVSGQLMHVFTGPVFWNSSMQSLAAGSSTESEVRAAYEMTQNVLFLQKILTHFNLPTEPFPVKIDSQGARDVVTHYAHTKHSRHLEVKHDVMRDYYQLGKVDYILIQGKYNPADLFTKALPKPKFIMFRKMIGMAELPVYLQTAV